MFCYCSSPPHTPPCVSCPPKSSSKAPPQRCFSSFSPSVLYSSILLFFFSLPSPLRACLSWCRAARREDTLMLSLLGWHNSTSLWGVKALTLPCLSVCLPGRLCSSPLSTSQTFPACRLVLALLSACLPACLSNKL